MLGGASGGASPVKGASGGSAPDIPRLKAVGLKPNPTTLVLPLGDNKRQTTAGCLQVENPNFILISLSFMVKNPVLDSSARVEFGVCFVF